jgi:hypothetical protein
VLEGIPQELQHRDQWVVHRDGAPYAARHTERRNGRDWGKGNKVDYTNPQKLSTFAEAWAMYLAGGWEGVGYSILASDPFLLIDIDHCVRADGTLAPTVHFWVQRLGGYVERSPGGDGLHILLQARLPRPGSVYWLHEESLHEVFKVEIYDATRFVRLTGMALPGRGLGQIADRHAELEEFIAAMRPEGATGKSRSKGHARPAPDWQPVRISPPMDDAQVLAAARMGRYAETFAPLYDRGTCENPAWAKDHSESGRDHFLISELCYWTQDPTQIERLMRRSALARPKYDEYHHGPNNPPCLQDLIVHCLGKKDRHYGNRSDAGATGRNGHHDRGETVPDPSPEPSSSNAADRAATAWRHLATNPYLTAAERNVLPALIGFAGYQMGQELPARAPIGYITPEMRAASGVCSRYFEAALPRLTALGVLTRSRRPSDANPGRRWYSYTVIAVASVATQSDRPAHGQLCAGAQRRVPRWCYRLATSGYRCLYVADWW